VVQLSRNRRYDCKELIKGEIMTMDELRRQLATTEWPLVVRVDGKDIPVGSREELMVPRAGNSICVYGEGTFEVIDCQHIATLHRTRAGSPQTT
jgi:hypothetical protein